MVSALPWGWLLAMFHNSAVTSMRKRVFLNRFVLWAAQLTNKPSYLWRTHPFLKNTFHAAQLGTAVIQFKISQTGCQH